MPGRARVRGTRPGPAFRLQVPPGLATRAHARIPTLHARFVLEGSELDDIRRALGTTRSVDRVFQVDITDGAGVVCAQVEKTIYVRRSAEPEVIQPSDGACG